MENSSAILGMLEIVRDLVVVVGLVGTAGLAVWMLPWSDADLDATQGELRAMGRRISGKGDAGVSAVRILERVAA